MRKRILRCWLATAKRRRTFLSPRRYTHRTGRTAAFVLAQASRSAQALLRHDASYRDSIWGDMEDDADMQVPRRAHDLLHVLGHDDKLGTSRRGVGVALLSRQYGATPAEMSRAVAALQTALAAAEPYPGHAHEVTLGTAVTALDDARYRLEPEPVVT